MITLGSSNQNLLIGKIFHYRPDSTTNPSVEAEYPILLVDTAEGIDQVAKLLEQEQLVGFDTEADFWEENKAQLALIQLTLPKNKLTVLIDPVESVDEAKLKIVHRDLTAIKAALENPEIVKPAHNASYDVNMLSQVDITVAGTRDTWKAALEIWPELGSASLAICCKYFLGIEISKEAQLSQWARVRPMTDQMTLYSGKDPYLALTLDQVQQAILEDARKSIASVLATKFSVAKAMRAIDKRKRELHELISSEGPELYYLAHKVEVLREACSNSLPAGTSEAFECPYGGIKPGNPKTEISLELLQSTFDELDLTVIQRRKLKRKVNTLIKEETTKGAVRTAIKKLGYRELGFPRVKELDAFLDTLMTDKVASDKVNIRYDFKAKTDFPKYTTNPEATPEELLEELSKSWKNMLDLQGTLPGFHSLRLQVKLLEEAIEESILNGAKPYEGAFGSVKRGETQSRVDVELLKEKLPTQLAGKLARRKIKQLLDDLITHSISKQQLKDEVFKSPAFEFLGLADSEERKDFWDQVLVETSGYYPNTVRPKLV